MCQVGFSSLGVISMPQSHKAGMPQDGKPSQVFIYTYEHSVKYIHTHI